jgi:hypothetical protein
LDTQAARVRKYVAWGLILAFIGIGAYIVRSSDSTPALSWMFVYDPGDFLHASAAGIVSFFGNLQIPIPPAIGLAEIISIRIAGTPILVTRYGYRLALVGTYVAALALAATSLRRMAASFLLSIAFLYVTKVVHPGNPQDYDIFFPLFFLAFLAFLKLHTRAPESGPGRAWLLPCGAGFCLSMAELSRPFMIFLLPLLLLGAYFILAAGGQRRPFLVFLIPVLLFSGVWHVYLLAAHGQLTFSNHAGFNISRAWPQIPAVPMVEETHAAPLASGRWPNLNTDEHALNNQRLQAAQFQYWFAHPAQSVLFAFSRVNDLLSGDTKRGFYPPDLPWLGLYVFLVRLTSSLVMLGAIILLIDVWRHLPRLPSLLSHLDNLLLLSATLFILFQAVGEAGEEPRLLLSLLPFFAVLPIYRSPGGDHARSAPPTLGW